MTEHPAQSVAQTATPQSPPEPPVRPTKWLWLWLWLALAACKMAHVSLPPALNIGELRRWAVDAAVVVHADLAWAMSLGLAGKFLICVCARRRLLPRALWVLMLVIGAVSVAYGVFSVRFFQYQRTPLTLPLLYMAGDARNMWSSVAVFATPLWVTLLLGAPAAYAALVLLCSSRRWGTAATVRFLKGIVWLAAAVLGACAVWLAVDAGMPRVREYLVGAWREYAAAFRGAPEVPAAVHLAVVATTAVALACGVYWVTSGTLLSRRGLIRILQAVGIAAAIVYIIIARAEASGRWAARHDDRLMAASPHVWFLRSCSSGLLAAPPVLLPREFPVEYLDDFRTVAQRPRRAVASATRPAGAPVNVIVIVGESLGARYMSIYGGRWPTTPNLEAEASCAMVFTSYYAHITNTPNALVAMLLSVYPYPLSWRHITREKPDIPGTTLAQILRGRGYRTAFIAAGDNEFENQGAFLRHDRGFDTIWDYRDAGVPPPDQWVFSWGVEDRYLIDMIVRWIELDRSRPFFIFSWSQGTHHPYYAGPGHKEIDFLRDDRSHGAMSWDLNNYLNAMHELDRQVERLFQWLRQSGLADNTIVVVTGDHGEAFGVPHPHYGHSYQIYQEDVRVPLILWNPRLFAGAKRNDTVGAQVDLMPTLADLLGVPPAPSWQGWSLFDPARPPRAYFYGVRDDYLLGLREGPWKYIFNATTGRQRLFNLDDDPDEQRDVSAAHGDMTKVFRQRLAAWVAYQRTVTGGIAGSK